MRAPSLPPPPLLTRNPPSPSLANLDQDLPNYAQYLIGIHSLDQEWLWCETWCSDESKVCVVWHTSRPLTQCRPSFIAVHLSPSMRSIRL